MQNFSRCIMISSLKFLPVTVVSQLVIGVVQENNFAQTSDFRQHVPPNETVSGAKSASEKMIRIRLGESNNLNEFLEKMDAIGLKK
ncbi:hypothetical protein T10_515 [Trichinella papuae]|uniref:Uncharacterized protein n=1 Tax=Trichinella papuae TaxID=268474 RepID=A0A0V1M9B2_9BILA|nr:hypothetical protein T10_9822 [Trichinella papuae]KRZ68436.1 hypothetical protein T10_515 [Trichinella papuae]